MRCRSAQEVAKAIRTMVIRGAPAIGVAAAMGIALGMRRSSAKGTQQFAVEFQKICELMAATRPTAVNLFWAIDRMKRAFAEGAQAGESVDEIQARLGARGARASTTRTSRAAARWARSAPTVVPDGARVLTHCNAGALATAGYGSALGVDPRGGRAGQADRRLRRRDAAVPAGRAAHRVGAGPRRHRHDRHHRQHGRAADARRRDRLRRRRRRPHRRQRRHGEQDRHLHGRGARARARRSRSTSRRRSRRSISRRPTATTSRSRSATSARSRTSAVVPARRPKARTIRNPAFDVTPHRYIAGIITERGIFRPPFDRVARRSAGGREALTGRVAARATAELP